jgi:hypothetical protein
MNMEMEIFPGLMRTELDWILGKATRKDNDVKISIEKILDELKEKKDGRRSATEDQEECGEDAK